MKTVVQLSLIVIAALALACAPPANTNTTTNANTNANTAPKAAAPTADSLLALDKPAWDAWKNKDGKYFETFLADNFVGFGEDGKRMNKAETIKSISEHKCEIKSHSFSNPRMTSISNDVAAVTYTATVDGTCDGKKSPSTLTAVSVFARSGDSWKAVYHNDVATIEPPPGAANSNSNAANAPMASADKKEAPAPPPAANSNAASSSNSSASGDALTDALMAMEKKGWDGWMKQDAATLQSVTTKDVTFVDITGKATHGQAEVVKGWTDGSCKVSSVDVTDGKGSMVADNVAILTFKGSAVGTCGSIKLESLWGTTIAVKEGDTWRAAYIFETPVRKG
jgi:ketosteroid isomerase-like protein